MPVNLSSLKRSSRESTHQLRETWGQPVANMYIFFFSLSRICSFAYLHLHGTAENKDS